MQMSNRVMAIDIIKQISTGIPNVQLVPSVCGYAISIGSHMRTIVLPIPISSRCEAEKSCLW